ncbi:MAG: biopolymer transporter ExbD [Alphaproteobacteria bacterium]|nr:biopolymer transporter ExbD [Alphaproteobacteria bacterium]
MSRLFPQEPPAPGLAVAALAPMVDLFTILLVVLIRTWSTDPPMDLAEADTALPLSRSEAPVGTGVIVDIGPSGLYVDGARAGSVAYHQSSDEVLVAEVHSALLARGGRRVVVRAHADTPWTLLGKVMFTAQQAGYEEVELVAASAASL